MDHLYVYILQHMYHSAIRMPCTQILSGLGTALLITFKNLDKE